MNKTRISDKDGIYESITGTATGITGTLGTTSTCGTADAGWITVDGRPFIAGHTVLEDDTTGILGTTVSDKTWGTLGSTDIDLTPELVDSYAKSHGLKVISDQQLKDVLREAVDRGEHETMSEIIAIIKREVAQAKGCNDILESLLVYMSNSINKESLLYDTVKLLLRQMETKQ